MKFKVGDKVRVKKILNETMSGREGVIYAMTKAPTMLTEGLHETIFHIKFNAWEEGKECVLPFYKHEIYKVV